MFSGVEAVKDFRGLEITHEIFAIAKDTAMITGGLQNITSGAVT